MSKARQLADLGNVYDDGALSNRNRIINGSMTIDQRNAGAAVTGINGAAIYSVDRWKSMAVNTWAMSAATFAMQQNRDALTPPPNFVNYLGVATTTAETSLPALATHELTQVVEGFNLADLGWGTANAKPVTLSFWVRSNLTGTFGGSFTNSAYNRAYVFSYTINSANTWEYKTIVVAGETTGTWLTNNGLGLNVSFSLGAGSSMLGTPGSWGSTVISAPTGQQQVCASTANVFYITGVQLEQGDTATPFEHRSYGDELARCQRYYFKVGSSDSYYGTGYASTNVMVIIGLPTTMRATPTVSYSSIGGSGVFSNDYSRPDRIQVYLTDTNTSASLLGAEADAEL